jgi:hypothetical protein
MRRRTSLVVVLALVGATWRASSAADSVRITTPAGVSFSVTNVGVATSGAPTATPVSFANLNVGGGEILRISLKADSDFVPPSGPAIPASRVSWTTSAAVNGTGSSGTLSRFAYTTVFQSRSGRRNGSVNLTWTLAAPGTPIRAGNHVLSARWRLEAITP